MTERGSANTAIVESGVGTYHQRSTTAGVRKETEIDGIACCDARNGSNKFLREVHIEKFGTGSGWMVGSVSWCHVEEVRAALLILDHSMVSVYQVFQVVL